MNQAWIKRCWNDVVAPKCQVFSVGKRHLIRHIFAREIGKRMRASNLHFIVNCTRMNVQSTAEKIWKAKHIVNLIWVIRSTRRDNRIGAHFLRFLWCNLGIGVCHSENHRIIGHAHHHILRDSALN